MANINSKFDAMAAEYRSRFPYLTDRQYESVVLTAADNCDGYSDAEALHMFGSGLESFAQCSEKDILEIV